MAWQMRMQLTALQACAQCCCEVASWRLVVERVCGARAGVVLFCVRVHDRCERSDVLGRRARLCQALAHGTAHGRTVGRRSLCTTLSLVGGLAGLNGG